MNMQEDLKIGVLLYGPSGCGKTYIAQATCNELGLNFFSVKGPELLNKYIGQSEQSVRDLFEKALQKKPSIVFFDEFDAIVPKRNAGNTGVTDRVVNQFLCYLDGVESMEGVCILAATSRPDLVDPALLRPGRIDRHVYLGFPNENERKEIINIYGKNKVEDLEYLVQISDGFCSADLVALIKEIRIKVAHDIIEEKKGQIIHQEELIIRKEQMDKYLKTFRPSTSKQEVKKLEQIYQQFSNPKYVQDISKQKQTLQ